jgi:hypothetical protein
VIWAALTLIVAVAIAGAWACHLTGYDWLVLVAIWPYGLLHTGVLVWALHRTGKKSRLSEPLR